MSEEPVQNEDLGPTIKLRSKEREVFELSSAAAKLSKLIEEMNEDNEDSDDNEEQIVDIVKVKSECLKKVVEFCEHHVSEPLNPITHTMDADTFDEIVTQEWYRTFVNVEQPLLFQIVQAANYMNIQPLLDLACLQVAALLMNKSAEDIRTILNIPKMTPEEEEKAKREHRWIFEA
uniref:E3 ubiquitin ligase complex SCF subunit n=1 Tax=Helicotheca tamesis TaxID=374047 RepID=A0A7S2H6U7_9STRA|mmetsp:Transcript_15729/g.21579  ORF Transcript_15729/g.21579 Transcript_15729/m.21579 type:complete len:176 (+) Transcript_15729:156-683(+)